MIGTDQGRSARRWQTGTMTQSPSCLDAYDEPPLVHAINGEILLSGPNAEAAYTLSAARELARRITAAIALTERPVGARDHVRGRYGPPRATHQG